jgi:L-fuconolactonase
MRINRRDFVRRSLGTAAAASLLGPIQGSRVAAAEGEPGNSAPLRPIVDTHQHLWDLSKFQLPWLKPDGELYRSYLSKDYLAAAEGLGIVKAVYMEVAVAPADKLAEAEQVIEICRDTDNPTVAAVIGGEPAAEHFTAYITRFKGSPFIKGVRQILPSATSEQGLYAEQAFAKGVRLLGELGMRFDLCMPPERLPDAVKLVDACPGTRFVLDHCGNADPKWYRDWPDESAAEAAARRRARNAWERNIAVLAERENVVGKISGIIARAPKEDWTPDDLAPIINHCLEVFGPDRVMFASDWPVCTRVASLKQWVAALKEIVRRRPESEQRRLLCDNAVRFYGLE